MDSGVVTFMRTDRVKVSLFGHRQHQGGREKCVLNCLLF
jgi:hypothetical protein